MQRFQLALQGTLDSSGRFAMVGELPGGDRGAAAAAAAAAPPADLVIVVPHPAGVLAQVTAGQLAAHPQRADGLRKIDVATQIANIKRSLFGPSGAGARHLKTSY